MLGHFAISLVKKQNEVLPSASLRARFAKGASWAVCGSVMSRGLTFLASVFCARLLGKIQFGELGIIQSTVGLFGTFAGLGLGLTAAKYVAEFRDRDNDKAGRILALSAIFAFFSGAIMSLLLAIAAPYLASHVLAAPEISLPLVVGSGLVFFGALNGAQTGALAGLEAFRTIAVVNAWAGVLALPLIAVGVWHWGLQGAVWGAVLALGANWLLNNFAIRRECRTAGIRYQFAECFSEFDVLRNFSLPAFLASIVVGPVMWICNALIVNQPDGYSAMAFYTAADKWRLLILFVPTSVAGTVLPMLSNLYGADDTAGYAKILRANLLLNFAITGIAATAVALFPLLILSVYGPAYRAASPILVLLAISSIPESLNTVLGYAVMSSVSVWWRLWFDIVLAGVLLGFAMWAIPRWSATGLAIAYTLAFSAASLGLFLFLRVRVPHTLRVVPGAS